MEKQPPASVPQLMTIVQVADRLRLSRRTIHRMVRDGQLDTIKIGRNTRIPEAAVIELINRGKSPS